MTRTILSVLAFGVMTSSVFAGTFHSPNRVEDGVVVLAAIVAVNGGGNTPNGEAHGVPRKNPAGKKPPGHNK